MLKLCVLALAVASVSATLVECDPCKHQCAVPCNSPSGALPVVWDNTVDKPEPVIHHGEFNLNPYNSIRPEYRDAPPSKQDLEKIWQKHLSQHNYKSPFVRPMKSGLWEAGVPNRYAPSGYNRRKFKSEEEALSYVRHKTGAGSAIDYQGALRSEAEIKGHHENPEPEIFEKGGVGEHGHLSVRNYSHKKKKAAFLEVSAKSPTSDEDINELQASERNIHEDDHVLDEAGEERQENRDHSLRIAHKMRDFLANYKPDHEVKVVDHGYTSR